MFTVHLDLVVWFVPPMKDEGHGIRLNRKCELPFVPTESVSIFSKAFDGCDEPLGYCLKEITWDIDNGCFLAETHYSSVGTPIALIPHEIDALLSHGWEFGSYRNCYSSVAKPGRKRKALGSLRIAEWDDGEVKEWELRPSRSRPKEFTTVLHAVISTMAELHNNCEVAFAMLKTGGFADLPEDRSQRRDLSPFETKFDDATREYSRMTFDQQWDWCKSVQRRYPRLIDVVRAIK